MYLDKNTPLIAREIVFRYTKIQWAAGVGWPTYFEPCPRNDKWGKDYSTKNNHHSLIWDMGGKIFQICDMIGIIRADKATQVKVLVNDDEYGDNTGSFELEILSYKQN